MSMHQPVRTYDTSRWAPLNRRVLHRGKVYFVPEWLDVAPQHAPQVEAAARDAAIWLWAVCTMHRRGRQ